MRAAFLILGKDLQLRARDRSVYLFALVIPLGMTFIFSNIFPDTEEVSVRAAIIDLDGGPIAESFVDGVVPGAADAGVVTLGRTDGLENARAALRRNELDAVWVLPAGFSDAVSAGREAEVQVLVSGESPLGGEVARGIAAAWTSRLEAGALAVTTAGEVGGSQVDPAALATNVAAGDPSLSLTSLVAPDRQLDAVSYLAAGMAIFFVFFTVQYGITGLLEERSLATLPRLLVAPIPTWAVHAGKALGAAVLGVASLTVLAIAANVILGADWGPPLGVAVLILASVLAAVGLMALVGSFARTAEQAGNFQSIVAIVLGMLGGAFFPLPATSPFLRILGLASPHTWFLRGLGDQTATGRWTDVLSAAAAIAAFGLIAGALAAWRLRRATSW